MKLIRTAIRKVVSSGSMEMRLYLVGYKGVCPSRRLRSLMAGSDWHRAWLTGHMGLYDDEDGRTYGVCDREWYRPRKGVRESGVREVLRVIVHPHAY